MANEVITTLKVDSKQAAGLARGAAEIKKHAVDTVAAQREANTRLYAVSRELSIKKLQLLGQDNKAELMALRHHYDDRISLAKGAAERERLVQLKQMDLTILATKQKARAATGGAGFKEAGMQALGLGSIGSALPAVAAVAAAIEDLHIAAQIITATRSARNAVSIGMAQGTTGGRIEAMQAEMGWNSSMDKTGLGEAITGRNELLQNQMRGMSAKQSMAITGRNLDISSMTGGAANAAAFTRNRSALAVAREFDPVAAAKLAGINERVAVQVEEGAKLAAARKLKGTERDRNGNFIFDENSERGMAVAKVREHFAAAAAAGGNNPADRAVIEEQMTNALKKLNEQYATEDRINEEAHDEKIENTRLIAAQNVYLAEQANNIANEVSRQHVGSGLAAQFAGASMFGAGKATAIGVQQNLEDVKTRFFHGQASLDELHRAENQSVGGFAQAGLQNFAAHNLFQASIESPEQMFARIQTAAGSVNQAADEAEARNWTIAGMQALAGDNPTLAVAIAAAIKQVEPHGGNP